MIIMARPHAMTRATEMAWPFMRRKSRHSFLSRWEIKRIPKAEGRSPKMGRDNKNLPLHSRTFGGSSFHQILSSCVIWSSGSPDQTAGGGAGLVFSDMVHAPIGKVDDAIGHVGHHGIMGDDDRERAQFTIHSLNRLQHDDAGAHVQGAGRFVAQQYFGPFGDGSRNGDRTTIPRAVWQ